MKMTKEEAIQELIDASQEEAKYGDKDNHYREIMRRIDAFDMGVKALKNNNFDEVVDFFNDIMDCLYNASDDYCVSTESILFARNAVYNVFSRRYRLKEIEKNGED